MGEENLRRMLPNKQIVLRNYIQGCPKESDFELRSTAVSTEIPHGSKGVLLKNLYLACDPYICHLLRPDVPSVFPQSAIVPGSVIRGYGVAKVMKSAYGELKEGDYVWGNTGWEDFSWNFDPEKLLTKIKNTDVPLSYYAGILGMPGIAAYAGLHEIFGSASTHQKVDLLKTKLGFDDAFNYKEGDLRSKLKKYFPKGIDIYFENVGGEMLDEVLLQMNIHGRVAVSGMISQYNLSEPQGIHNLFSLVEKRLILQGFVEFEYKHMYPEYVEWAVKKLEEKKLIYVEDVNPGLENAASAFVGIYQGHNIGKQIVVVAED
ncbi:hypothetical protein Pfo_022690 [Paulownia fortunei]|nr:hypothetical protein Pfo_022690 [Paulownia fortunei]